MDKVLGFLANRVEVLRLLVHSLQLLVANCVHLKRTLAVLDVTSGALDVF